MIFKLENWFDWPVNLPSLPEQQKIAAFLGAVDGKIAALRRQEAGLARFKAGLMQQLFSQKLRFTRDDGSAFPDWEEKRLGEIATFAKGKGISKDDISPDGAIPCIRYGELYTTYAERISDVISRTNCAEREVLISKGGEVIIPASGGRRRTWHAPVLSKTPGLHLAVTSTLFHQSNMGLFLPIF